MIAMLAVSSRRTACARHQGHTFDRPYACLPQRDRHLHDMAPHTPTEEHAENVLRIHRVEVVVGIGVRWLRTLAEHIAVGVALGVISSAKHIPDEHRSRVASVRHSMYCRLQPHA